MESIFPFRGGLNLDSVKDVLANAPALFGVMWLGGLVLGIPLAILTYFLSFFIVNRYQVGIKAKLARQKEKIRGKVLTKSRKRRQK